jgi:hypothetical protein
MFHICLLYTSSYCNAGRAGLVLTVPRILHLRIFCVIKTETYTAATCFVPSVHVYVCMHACMCVCMCIQHIIYMYPLICGTRVFHDVSSHHTRSDASKKIKNPENLNYACSWQLSWCQQLSWKISLTKR